MVGEGGQQDRLAPRRALNAKLGNPGAASNTWYVPSKHLGGDGDATATVYTHPLGGTPPPPLSRYISVTGGS